MKNFIKYFTLLLFLQSEVSIAQNQSLLFDGVDDWFIINPYQKLNLGTGDFTIEAMIDLNQKNLGFHNVLTNNNLTGGGVFFEY